MKCDLCEKNAVWFDTWFNTQSCDEHRHIPPRDRQKILAERTSKNESK